MIVAPGVTLMTIEWGPTRFPGTGTDTIMSHAAAMDTPVVVRPGRPATLWLAPSAVDHEPRTVRGRAVRVSAWSDLPTGNSRLSEVRRQLRVLQVRRVAGDGDLAA